MKPYAKLLAMLVFLAFVVLLEGNGYIIHKLHYDMGAGWTPTIIAFDWALKFVLYQLVIWMLLAVHKNWKILAWMEVFWCTCTQDLFFYMVWNGCVFPVGNWTWMPLYPYLGAWTTSMQIALSVVSLLAVTVIINWRKLVNAYHPCAT